VESRECETLPARGGGAEAEECVFVLSGGRAFRCNMAGLGKSEPDPAAIRHSAACREISRTPSTRAPRRVAAALAAAARCIRRGGLHVHGGVVPPGGQATGGPEGELITTDAFVAFYADAQLAKRAEPMVLRNAQHTAASKAAVVRRGSVTVLWLTPPPSAVRVRVQSCAFRPY
jgi:hypothetical protein